MALVVIYTQADGSVGVIVPAPTDRRSGETEAQQAARVLASAVPTGGVSGRVVSDSVLPDYRFFPAWRDSGSAVAPNLAAARIQRRQELLVIRDSVLVRLNDRYQQALDEVDVPMQTTVRNRRVRLRNLGATLTTELAAVATIVGVAAYNHADLTDPV